METSLKNLAIAARKNSSEFSRTYLENAITLNTYLKNHSLLKAEIKAKDIEYARDIISFSSVFNDISFVSVKGGKDMICNILRKEGMKLYFGVDQVYFQVSEKQIKEFKIDLQNPECSPGFTLRSDEEMDLFLKEVAPLIESSRVLIVPERILLAKQPTLNDAGGHNWNTIEVDPLCPFDVWETRESNKDRPIPIKFTASNSNITKELFEVSIPYISGIPFHELNQLLNDEQDLISSLRLSLKDIIAERSNSSSSEMINDLVNPKLDQISRKFKSASRIHGLKIGGAFVGTAVLAYSAFMSGGLSSAITSIASASGIGLLSKEMSDYQAKKEELKQDPYYFLWRCKEIKRKT